MQDRKIRQQFGCQAVGERHDDREDHGGRAHHRGADQHRFRRRLERVARAVVLFQIVLALVEIGSEAEILLDLTLDSGDLFDGRKLENGLGVVGHRTVGIHRDGHRAHAEKSERHQTEGEHGRGQHQAGQSRTC